MEMGKQVYQPSQMLNTQLCFIILDPILLWLNLNPIHCVVPGVSSILQEALSLACKCRRKTIFCHLFTATNATNFHKLYHLIDNRIADLNWLLIIYNHDFGSALNEIFLSLPDIMVNDSSMSPAWSCMVAENRIWELAIMLTSDSFPLSRMIKETEILTLCVAKLVEADNCQLQNCCLMTISKITAAAESNLDFRCDADYSDAMEETGIVIAIRQLLARERVCRTVASQHPELKVLIPKPLVSLTLYYKY